MKQKQLVFVSVLMAVAVILSSCASPTVAPTDAPAVTAAPTEVVIAEEPFGENLPTAPTIDTPLVVAYRNSHRNSARSLRTPAYDADVAGMTQIAVC